MGIKDRFAMQIHCFFLVFFMLIALSVNAEIRLNAQVRDLQVNQGSIKGWFQESYTNVDVYLILLQDQTDVFSLQWNSLTNTTFWESGIHVFASPETLDQHQWITVSPVDFSEIMKNAKTHQLYLFLIEKGKNPVEVKNWIAYTDVALTQDPMERVVGQSYFLTPNTMIVRDPSFTNAVDDDSIPPPDEAAEDTDGQKDTEPEKPDIFKIQGNYLFYANGSSGKLQWIDLTLPEQPLLKAEVQLENTPRELYILGQYVYLIEDAYLNDRQSIMLHVYDTQEGRLNQVNTLQLDDLYYNLSRRLDNTIYLVGTLTTSNSQWVDVDSAYMYPNSNTMVFALSMGKALEVKAKTTLPGYTPEIYLDSSFLVVILNEDWLSTVLHVFDLRANGQDFSAYSKIQVPGYVPSEYHVYTKDKKLFVVYRNQDIKLGSVLSVYDMANPEAIQMIGEVSAIAPGEELYATRFSGNRAYVVTYERQDPLWVIDIENPLKPRILGELKVPGWSEFMRFYDNKLIAVGYDDSEGGRLISVAMFSVDDPKNPTLIDRVTPFSGVISYSYSVAVDDDRAFYINPNTNMILVPINYYETEDVSGLEIIRLNSEWSTFSSADFVQSDFRVLRGTDIEANEIIVSMGDAALETIRSNGKPEVLGKLRLAYNVSCISGFDHHKRLWALGGDFYWGGNADIMVYQPNDLLTPFAAMSSDMRSPIMITNGNDLGVMYSNEDAQIRAIDLDSMNMTKPLSMPNDYSWSMYSPFIQNSIFYVGVQKYAYLSTPKEDTTDIAVAEDIEEPVYDYSTISWQLARYDFSEMDEPKALKEVSIPGNPIGLNPEGKLITVETYCMYRPYEPSYMVDDVVSAPEESLMPSILPPQESTCLMQMNLLTLTENQAILEYSRDFTFTNYQIPEVLFDKEYIYISKQKDEKTEILVLNSTDFSDKKRFELEGNYSGIAVYQGKIVLSSSGPMYYVDGPMYVESIKYRPSWYESGYVVYDLNGDSPKLLLKKSNEWVGASEIIISDTGIYVSKGYEGISYFPYE
ncbi:MAG: beta-propeller domain-containing protein [Desulfobacterales bacterium]|nr:beta-propeller domain-containing protein [Desulfobacterales bacterium]